MTIPDIRRLPSLRLAILICLPLVWASADRYAFAADPTLTVDGAVAHPLTLTTSDLAALPQSDVHVAYLTGHGPEDATYSGVTLWSLIEKAGLEDAFKDRRSHSAHYLLLSASDGYQVVLGLGEIDPDLEGKSALIALKRDGQPIDPKDVFRLALPGDKHGARNMHAITRIELK